MPEVLPSPESSLSPEEYEAQRARDQAGMNGHQSEPIRFPSRQSSGPSQSSSTIGRQLPNSQEAEESLLGCCLIEEDEGLTLTRSIESGIDRSSFYFPPNGIVFETLARMSAAKKPISAGVLGQELKDAKQIDQVGGFNFIVQITQNNPTTAQATYYISKVRELALLREMIRTLTIGVEDAYNFSGDVDTFAAEIQRRTTLVTEKRLSRGTAYTVWSPAAFRAYQPPPNLNILGSGYLRRRQLTTLIGPPGVGKSRLSLWMGCSHICGRNFMGLESVNAPSKWLFFGNENDPLRQKTDLDWFYRSLKSEEQTLVDNNLFLHVLEKPDDGIITLADPEAYAKLTSTLKTVKPDVVVFDPWGNMIEGNENDNEEIRRTLKALFRAIATCCPDAAILVIHHARTGKSTAIEAGNNFSGGSLGRGSKALVSAARCELALWAGHSEDSSRLVLTCEKVNNVKKFEPKGLVFENGIYREDHEFSVDAWRDDIEGARSTKTLTIADLVEAVKQGNYKAGDIAKYCEENYEASKPTVNRRLAEAVAKEYLCKTQPIGSYTLGNKAMNKK